MWCLSSLIGLTLSCIWMHLTSKSCPCWTSKLTSALFEAAEALSLPCRSSPSVVVSGAPICLGRTNFLPWDAKLLRGCWRTALLIGASGRNSGFCCGLRDKSGGGTQRSFSCGLQVWKLALGHGSIPRFLLGVTPDNPQPLPLLRITF